MKNEAVEIVKVLSLLSSMWSNALEETTKFFLGKGGDVGIYHKITTFVGLLLQIKDLR